MGVNKAVKNLMTFINPSKEFGKDYESLVKIQIDNANLLGWKSEDVMLVTNFPYEYGGIKAIEVPDSCYFAHRKRGSKLTTICYMFDNGLIADECWFHDFDAHQLQPFAEGEPDLEGKDAGFTTYGLGDYLVYWNSGSFFFKPATRDIFNWMKHVMYRYNCNDEQALNILTRRNENNINSRYKMLNCTYNLCRLRNTVDTYNIAVKPIRVLHFHPKMQKVYNECKPLMSKELLEIFEKHGYK